MAKMFHIFGNVEHLVCHTCTNIISPFLLAICGFAAGFWL
jgi:hypothetical protein